MTPRSRGVGTLRDGRPADYLPPGTVGQWPPAAGQWWTVQKGGDPRTDHAIQGDDSDPGLASRRDCVLTATLSQRGTLKPAWVAHNREGAQRPQCAKGRGPKDPGVAAPLPAAVCRGNCWRDTGGRSGLLAELMDSAFCRASAYSFTTGPLEGGSACVSPFARTQEDLLGSVRVTPRVVQRLVHLPSLFLLLLLFSALLLRSSLYLFVTRASALSQLLAMIK